MIEIKNYFLIGITNITSLHEISVPPVSDKGIHFFIK